jgi:predicted metallopeptidase
MARVTKDANGNPTIHIDVDEREWTRDPEVRATVAGVVAKAIGLPPSENPEGLDYYRSDEVMAVARRLVDRHAVTLARLRDFELVYLLRHVEGELEEKRLDAIAKAFKAPALWHDVAGVDAGIWIDDRYWKLFGEQQREAVCLHELLHLGVNDNGQIKLLDHDVEDFGMVVRLYGPWIPNLRRFAEQLALFSGDGAKEAAS